MEIKRGIAVSPGIAIGPALVLDTEGVRIPHRQIPAANVGDEIQRLHEAIAHAAHETRQSQLALTAKLGSQYGAIFAAHSMLFDDPSLLRELDEAIRAQLFSAEYAVSKVIRRYARALESLGADHYLSSRTADLFDVERRILDRLLGNRRESLDALREPVIVLAGDLMPSETAALDPNKVFAFATESGGRTSHTAIMAGALEIPAVVGLGKFLTNVSGGDLVIVDGDSGLVLIDPDAETLERYQALQVRHQRQVSLLSNQRSLTATTLDGTRITLMANIEFPQEAEHCIQRGSDGVGLYRTEFLYVGKSTDPTESDHFDAYMTVLRILGPEQPVTIRTLDLGADKFSNLPWAPPAEKNPFLGLRSVRLCLRNLTLFKTQMRAILRASAFGNVRILFPMVSTLLELRQCKMILSEVKEDLEEEGIAFQRNIPVGTMIEVPSAALIANNLAREVDFFSLGTNDLVQYTLAADRNNEHVASLNNPADPAVLRLLKMVIDSARNAKIQANVCGEMSGDPLYTQLLLGLGYRQLSVTPHNIPEIKKLIRSVTLSDAEQVAQDALQLETARDVTNYLREQMRKILPDQLEA
ncbi:phosphoenolpyruvate--protein phosphotransferase [Tuwongella immobilis]|uniref:Phosphoenolpyruvate-protein phosphotransferase n=1 Tax=Tuwongella immobilis TaxID=692036 RepID=A0A6C2YP86_9BACT|nr:phosphoenolpyruvate--protein phosphotransferase [Tuwongella immobilis]VIP02943.1 phosphoenolpyruvate-protein phosphotransferase : Phosphoenolpyruvate-protein phosphotransferase OS=uncultured planctomycete GN=HGMM_F07G10C17 PE=3 SV=1: PEP-utilisers_N: PEP-utilizers: PEP-utilizers_C [Tuwongella immobilis]VTS02917.1 phosphoenolpyruvate-protein phosphotransferase : Phosphoenolpyruvate-protein phosphotransferase OS=uncultured planctomycete GN=HGMM_F07G10C17 PE=3 SV=1: PEP-utilisers_N: PEP-utilizers